MLHKDISEMIRYAKIQGILDVKMNTNASLLSPNRARAILEAGLDTLVFSVDAANRQDFERIRTGGNFERIVENIRTFNEIRRTEYPHAKIRTRVSMVLIGEWQDVHQAANFWGGIVDEFAYRWAIPRARIYAQADSEKTRPCSLLWERLYVWWDGTINPCDEDYLSHLNLGRLDGKQNIRQAWHSERMSHYRELHLSQQKNNLFPCIKCPGF